MSDRCYELNAPTVIGEIIDGEVMVMNLQQGIYYSVAGAGAAIWPALSGGCPSNTLAAALSSATGVPLQTIDADLDAFVQRLLDETILRPADASGTAAAPTLDGIANYDGLAFERYDDMRAMLILDPVHEVGEFGWPQRGEPPPEREPDPKAS